MLIFHQTMVIFRSDFHQFTSKDSNVGATGAGLEATEYPAFAKDGNMDHWSVGM